MKEYTKDVEQFNKQFKERLDRMERTIWVEELFKKPWPCSDDKKPLTPKLANYMIGDTDDYGRLVHIKGRWSGYSPRHASMRAAIQLDSVEIYITGFYTAELITDEDKDDRIADLQRQIDELTTLN
jgi:hypothetical protein